MKRILSYLNICNLYIFIWILYNFHWNNCQLPFIEGVSNVLLGLNLLISLYYSVITINNYKLPAFFGSVKLILVIFSIYGIIYIFFGPDRFHDGHAVKRGTYLISVLRSFLPIFVFYFFTKKGYLTPNTLKFWSIIFLLSFIYIFYKSVIIRGLTTNVTDFVNNTGYLFPIAVPCVYYWKKSTTIQLIYMGICFVLVILSLKRGAILCTSFAILMFFAFKLKNASHNSKVGLVCVCIVSLISASYFISTRLSESVAFQNRIDKTLEGNTSGRDQYAYKFVNYFFNDTNAFQFLFGSGGDATLTVNGNYAHNDWLEILINQGLIGIMVYAYFIFRFYKQWRITKSAFPKQIIGSYFVIYFLKSILSMGYSMISPIESLGIAYAIAENQNKKTS